MKNLLLLASCVLFALTGGMIYAYVYDVEPLSAEKHYAMEREIYARDHHYDYQSFPSFNEWVAEQGQKERAMNEYISDLSEKFGRDCADLFDWSQPMSAEKYAIEKGD